MKLLTKLTKYGIGSTKGSVETMDKMYKSIKEEDALEAYTRQSRDLIEILYKDRIKKCQSTTEIFKEIMKILKFTEVEEIASFAFHEATTYLYPDERVTKEIVKDSYEMFDYLIERKFTEAIDRTMVYRREAYDYLGLDKDETIDLKHDKVLEELIKIESVYSDSHAEHYIEKAIAGCYGKLKSEKDYFVMLEDLKESSHTV